jgi:hypothetical protein
MNKNLRWLSLSLIAVVVMVQFNNCSAYAPPPNSYYTQSSVSCINDNCITPTVDNLSLRVNWGGGSEYTVKPIDGDLNLGGDCNEGGYPVNVVRWDLYLNNALVRNSAMIPADARCVNGRFLVYVRLTSVAGDPVDRTGLLTQTGARAPYDLWIEIVGYEKAGGTPIRNNLKGRMRMSLLAGAAD